MLANFLIPTWATCLLKAHPLVISRIWSYQRIVSSDVSGGSAGLLLPLNGSTQVITGGLLIYMTPQSWTMTVAGDCVNVIKAPRALQMERYFAIFATINNAERQKPLRSGLRNCHQPSVANSTEYMYSPKENKEAFLSLAQRLDFLLQFPALWKSWFMGRHLPSLRCPKVSDFYKKSKSC